MRIPEGSLNRGLRARGRATRRKSLVAAALIPAVQAASSVQLALSAFGWAVGSGRIDAASLPQSLYALMLFGGPATFLMLGPDFESLFLLTLTILVCALGLAVTVGNATRKKWLLGCAFVWWLVSGLAAATVGV
jgi:hypothetical protein